MDTYLIVMYVYFTIDFFTVIFYEGKNDCFQKLMLSLVQIVI